MIKYFCDACGKEIQSNIFEYTIKYHITEEFPSYICVDKSNDIIGTSGRNITYQLCNKCYNQVMYKSYEEFNKIKNHK